jgi:small subunit ribosomal protein S17
MAKTLTGVVSSDKGDKTIVVTVTARKTHPIYKKQYTFSKKFMAHDEKNEAKIGDKVVIAETRPLSARKRFTLERIVEKPILRENQMVTGDVEEVAVQPKAPKKAEASEGDEQ